MYLSESLFKVRILKWEFMDVIKGSLYKLFGHGVVVVDEMSFVIVSDCFLHLAKLVVGEAKGRVCGGYAWVDNQALVVEADGTFEVFVLPVAVA